MVSIMGFLRKNKYDRGTSVEWDISDGEAMYM